MKDFLGRDFLLKSRVADKLYYEYAEKMPIFDFHNHLSPEEIYTNKNYATITELWLKGDHYKWRAMRAAGVNERYITGDAGDYEKFEKWANTIERLPGSALYHWTHLELKRYFDIEIPLSSKTAASIYKQCNDKLAQPEFTPVSLLKKAGVAALCTTDDPFDSLEWHHKVTTQELPFKVLPTFRPDKIVHIRNQNWVESISKLAASEKREILSLESLKAALIAAIARFKNAGCLAADLGFESFLYTRVGIEDETMASEVFEKAIDGNVITVTDAELFESYLLRFLGETFSELKMCMQLHMGASRNVNTVMYRKLGPDVGVDHVGLPIDTVKLGMFLDDLNLKSKLPRTILYSLNPGDISVLTGLAVSFCSGECPGKVQTGSAWWFNDTEYGMRTQLRESAYAGLLSSFVGMVTDSRSFSSFVRHEYFRRILCNMLGDMVENGEYPDDVETLGALVQDVCYNNAERYFMK